MRRKDTNTRIAIVGAGISGLAAAYYLREKGYNNITIFEAEDRPGGKILSWKQDGDWYELGAVFTIDGYTTVQSLARRYKAKLSKQARTTTYYRDGQPRSPFRVMAHDFGYLAVAKSAVRFASLIRRHKELERPGFAGAAPELYASFKSLFSEEEMAPFASLLGSATSAYGYGNLDTTPALYYLKLLQSGVGFVAKDVLNSTLGLRLGTMYTFDHGYQSLLESIARDFDVRLHSKVSSIMRERDGEKDELQITCGGRGRPRGQHRETFDNAILSSMPIHTLDYLDVGADEKEIFSEVRYVSYHEILFRGHMPFRDGGVLLDVQSEGDPACLVRFFPDKDIYQSFHSHSGGLSEDELEARLRKVVGGLGGTITEKIRSRSLLYFPHFQEASLRRLGPYERLEAMQGNRGTYYIGSLFNMEGAELSARYARHLVGRHF